MRADRSRRRVPDARRRTAVLGVESHRIRNVTYRYTVRDAEGDDISEQTASLDWRRFVNAGLLDLFVGDGTPEPEHF